MAVRGEKRKLGSLREIGPEMKAERRGLRMERRWKRTEQRWKGTARRR
ncbi:hypothetical protein J19TS2_00480 [Cohnella xylanilytica]|nr:hypothetical protein J19TS2_00480 [Cohnella xylanilytica]